MSEGLAKLQQVLGTQEQPKFHMQQSPRLNVNSPIKQSPLVKEIVIGFAEEESAPRFVLEKDGSNVTSVEMEEKKPAAAIQETKPAIDTDAFPRFRVNEPSSPPETEINVESKKPVNNYSVQAINALYESQNYEATRVSTVKSENTVSTLNTVHSSDKDEKDEERIEQPRFVVATQSQGIAAVQPTSPVAPPIVIPSPPVLLPKSLPTTSPETTVAKLETANYAFNSEKFTYSPGQYSTNRPMSSTSFNIPPPPSDSQSELDLSDIELEAGDYLQRKKELEQKLLEFMSVGKQETQLGKRIAKSLKRRNVTVSSELDDFEIGSALKEYEIQRRDTQVTASDQALEALKQSLMMAVPSKMGPPIPPLPSVKTILEQRELKYQQYAKYSSQSLNSGSQGSPEQPLQMQPVQIQQMQPMQIQQVQPMHQNQRMCPNCKQMTNITSKAAGFCCLKVHFT
ncbi:hypothetical protein HDV01_001304 [Terramyces sp. JEL0728]|nr:hypothetical protein HDV01_001304 [Terramyces sp. JEL0728]